MNKTDVLNEKKSSLRASVKARAAVVAAIQRMDGDREAVSADNAVEERTAKIELADAILTEKPTHSILARLFGNRDRLHVIALTRDGLQEKLDAIEARIITIEMPAFEAARADRDAEVIGTFNIEYLRTAKAFTAVLRRGVALGMALQNETLTRACEMSTAFDILTLDSIDQVGDAFTGREYEWRSDPKAKALYEAHQDGADFSHVLSLIGPDAAPSRTITPARAEWWDRMEAALAS